MPTYEYACRSCGEHLEVVQSFRDDPLTVCPNCGAALRKVFSPVGIVFKGSGFYKNDSRESAQDRSKAASAAKAGDGPTKDGSAKDGSSKDGGSKEAGSGAKEAGSGGEGTAAKADAKGGSAGSAPGTGSGTGSTGKPDKAASAS